MREGLVFCVFVMLFYLLFNVHSNFVIISLKRKNWFLLCNCICSFRCVALLVSVLCVSLVVPCIGLGILSVSFY